MKILIVNSSDMDGGAARAANRLHKALLNENIDSQMLVQKKSNNDHTIIGPKNKLEKFINDFFAKLDSIPTKFYRHRSKTRFSPSWISTGQIVKQINDLKPDIVHLHWIGDGMISIEDLVNINAPIVWSLHDMWLFTGGCHYDDECKAYKENCGHCRILGSSIDNDISRKIFSRKQKSFLEIPNMTVIGLSRWLAGCAKESVLLKNRTVLNLPNPIDIKKFSPYDQKKSRKHFSLDNNKKLILFGAMGTTSVPRKGFRELKDALKKLKGNEIELVIMGSDEPKEPEDFGFSTHYLGHIYNDMDLVKIYSAADVLIVPSLQENLSNAIMESLACATPVVGFDIGGNADMIDHCKNGYLAKPFDTQDLANGIDWVLHNKNYDNLCLEARKKVVKEFDSVLVSKKYIDAYKDILNGK